MSYPDHRSEVRRALSDPARLCATLGWGQKMRRQARGVIVLCPVHGERRPSCSVTLGPDGTVRVCCWGCGWTGDAFTMVAVAHGLDPHRDFREVMAIGAELAGQHVIADEIRGARVRKERPLLPVPEPQPEPEYPPETEVEALWGAAHLVARDADAASLLRSRGFDLSAVVETGMVRVVARDAALPRWAAYGKRSWVETGHRILMPAFDCRGHMKSVRSWRCTDGTTPKRLPPAGHRAAHLVLANRLAIQMLRRRVVPSELWICEGEPDCLVAATSFAKNDAVIGINSGSWSPDFARCVHERTRVYVATHADEAGDRYAEDIIATLGTARHVSRWRPAA